MAKNDERTPDEGRRDSLTPEEADRLASRFTSMWDDPAPERPGDAAPGTPAAPEAPAAPGRTDHTAAPGATQPVPQATAGATAPAVVTPPSGAGATEPNAGTARPTSSRRRIQTLIGLPAPPSSAPPAPPADAAPMAPIPRAPNIPNASKTMMGLGSIAAPQVPANPRSEAGPPAPTHPPHPAVPPAASVPVRTPAQPRTSDAQPGSDLLPEYKAEYAPPAALPAPVKSADWGGHAITVRAEQPSEHDYGPALPSHGATAAPSERVQRTTDPPKRPRDSSAKKNRIATIALACVALLSLGVGAVVLVNSTEDPHALDEDPTKEAPPSDTSLPDPERDDPPSPQASAAAPEATREPDDVSTVAESSDPAGKDDKDNEEPSVHNKPSTQAAPPKPKRPATKATKARRRAQPKPRPTRKPTPPPRGGGAIVREAPF